MSLATFLTALGIALMKKAHNDKDNKKAVFLRPPWILGMSSKIFSSVITVFAFSLANQSTLSPISALTMVFNIALAWKFLNERLSKYDIIGMLLMGSGAVLAEIYSNKATVDLDYNDLQTLFSR